MDFEIFDYLGELAITFGVGIVNPFSVNTLGLKVSMMYILGNFLDKTCGD
jgi:hypothetical protein